MSVAPYWGHLPASKNRRASASDQYNEPDDPGQSLDQPKRNRVSVQTTHTDAPAESTSSPLASPLVVSFNGAGLAPRPPELPYGQNPLPPELVDRRKRRSARNREALAQEAARATPPAAPEIPRAPPVSYKPSHGNGDSAYTYNASGQPGPPASAHRSIAQARAGEMDPDALHKDALPTSERQHRAAVLDRSLQRFDDDSGAGRLVQASDHDLGRDVHRTNSTRWPTNGDRRDRGPVPDASTRVRRQSLGTEAQRKKWADDRSPLQKLELTLDSITKEEKRARVEAAERRARERAEATAAANAPRPHEDRSQHQPDRSTGPQVRFCDRGASTSQDERRRPVATDPIEAQPPEAISKDPSSNHPTEEDRYGASGQPLRSQVPVARSRDPDPAPLVTSGLPQRNLSFRDRAAKTDLKTPPAPDDSPVTTPSGGISLTRNGSNKLRKNPPGDPWYSTRRDIEQKFPAVTPRGQEREEPHSASSTWKIRSGESVKKSANKPPTTGNTFEDYEDFDHTPSQSRSLGAATGLGRSASMGPSTRPLPEPPTRIGPARPAGNGVKRVAFPASPPTGHEPVDYDSDSSRHDHHHFREFIHRDKAYSGQGMYTAPKYLDEWKKGTVGTLCGALLDVTADVPAPPEGDLDKDMPWWEGVGKRNSLSSRPKKAEAFDGEYDETQAPTRFKPPLYLKCGPLLRYCGIRHEKGPLRSNRSGPIGEKEIWRGTVMIVTQDSESSYDITPILRLFVQPIDLLPPPPAELRGEQALLPEYVDPIAGIPKLGRRGETLYVRPVEHLEESKDASLLEPDDGLFEVTRSAPDFDNAPDPPGSFASRKRRIQVDGEKLGKYKDVRGFRLHAERGCTFWRFNVEVELTDQQQRIAYRINRGPSTGFWVPARGQAMNVMFHTCNGFSLSVDSDELSGPDPMWRDVLNTHQTQPFHVMIGGGDQIYNDAVMRKTTLFQDWLHIKNPLHKNNAPFTADMQDELEDFYLERYSMWFSQGLFGLANSQIPMVNMYDDHDIIDGFGSYPNHFMKSPVFSGLGAVAFKYYMLFQHQSLIDEGEQNEQSWVLGCSPGPYIQELSRSLFMSLGSGLALLAVDARTERTREEVVREDTWKKLIDRCYAEVAKGKTRHLLVLLGVPIAYPRLVWLETILTSRLMDPVKALGKAGLLGNLLNRFDGGVEVLDDLDDHWTAKNHKDERKFVMEDLQDLAADKSVRITILSGDVHLAAIGRFYSNPKLNMAKHKDFRYMPNIISSAIVNTPPPDLVADVLNKRNKVHHFDKETDEDMIPIFTTGVDGKPRNNKHLLPHRNWCSIREYVPGNTPPPTPPPEDSEYESERARPVSRGGLFRRLSLSKTRGPSYRPDVPDEKDRSRPPITGGLFRSFSRRASSSGLDNRPSGGNKLTRTLSLGRGDNSKPKSGFSSRGSSTRRPKDGGINGDWGSDSEQDIYEAPPQRRIQPTAFDPAGVNDKQARMGLRGGTGAPRDLEYTKGDDSYFTARPPRRAFTQPAPSVDQTPDSEYAMPPAPAPAPRPFHRTPTGLSVKQLKRGAQHFEVNLEGGLDITLNVEVNAKDPAGITVPYRLIVPKLEYEYLGEDGDYGANAGELEDYDVRNADAGIETHPRAEVQESGLKRLFSKKGKDKGSQQRWNGDDRNDEY
ncbi:uncharacterized protein BCR38DRAFT_356855 [Pseudomassariella vexata]|uniref:PhoD-like phosphatase domain-containing protein n=1 Tax=Pseudomassariella vexata TaxID=1141098 RepID=A0A1Y2D8H9_9PEZI|nr:uncharacterized protein BCR38DRAFT_356855 [Pseudomassariella vexata]ORY55436.1 hypothetical protein BCR38DRAFT_356855 [Pseudomassariella vexata]